MKRDVLPEDVQSRVVAVDREVPLRHVLEQAGLKVYASMTRLDAVAPLAETLVTVTLIRIGYHVVYDQLDEELARRGLRLSFDPWAIAAWLRTDPRQIARYPVGMQGINRYRRSLRAAFEVTGGMPSVTFDHFDVGWGSGWYFSAQAL